MNMKIQHPEASSIGMNEGTVLKDKGDDLEQGKAAISHRSKAIGFHKPSPLIL